MSPKPLAVRTEGLRKNYGNTVALAGLDLVPAADHRASGYSAGMLVHPLAFPITMLSTGFLPAEAMPSWMTPIAEWNPNSTIISTLRDLFGHAGVPSDSRPAEHAGFLAVPIPIVLLALCVPTAVRRFRAPSR